MIDVANYYNVGRIHIYKENGCFYCQADGKMNSFIVSLNPNSK